MAKDFEVVAVHLRKRLALLDDDSTMPIANLLDADGEECYSDENPAWAIAGPDPNNKWHRIDLSCFEEQTECH